MLPQDLHMSCTWVFAHVFRNVCVCFFCSLSAMCGFFFEVFSQSSDKHTRCFLAFLAAAGLCISHWLFCFSLTSVERI